MLGLQGPDREHHYGCNACERGGRRALLPSVSFSPFPASSRGITNSKWATLWHQQVETLTLRQKIRGLLTCRSRIMQSTKKKSTHVTLHGCRHLTESARSGGPAKLPVSRGWPVEMNLRSPSLQPRCEKGRRHAPGMRPHYLQTLFSRKVSRSLPASPDEKWSHTQVAPSGNRAHRHKCYQCPRGGTGFGHGGCRPRGAEVGKVQGLSRVTEEERGLSEKREDISDREYSLGEAPGV